ncbi:hypothetical protein [Leptolyngbya sp. 'hensonii']|uniref:hypothetical protein n=1 Tax=Leptolyngbya sp. 'hensonii' TaxID=1922337 RepID=UPI000AB93647|nr:hypothetical protein [Leptolyngbya sp. 'hensonii']
MPFALAKVAIHQPKQAIVITPLPWPQKCQKQKQPLDPRASSGFSRIHEVTLSTTISSLVGVNG